jgi:catalase
LQQDRTRHGGFGKDAALGRREKPCKNPSTKGPALPKSPSGHATPASIVNALKAIIGRPSEARASFVSGQCVRGTYAASDRAAEVTKCRSFTRPSRVLARFAVDGRNPGLRGFSFRLGGQEYRSDILTQSAPMHFARTLDQMLAYLTACAPGPGGKPDIDKVKAFSAANPETLHQASYIAAHPPRSFAATTYWGVHAFPVTNSNGRTRFIKFKVVPVGTDAEPAEGEADIPYRDLEKRIATGEVRFSVVALAILSWTSPSVGPMRTPARRYGWERS